MLAYRVAAVLACNRVFLAELKAWFVFVLCLFPFSVVCLCRCVRGLLSCVSCVCLVCCETLSCVEERLKRAMRCLINYFGVSD